MSTKKPEEKKTAAAKPTAKSTAAKTTPAKPAAKSTATKTAAKAPAKAAAKSSPKKAAPKAKPITIDDLCAKLEKKISKTKAAAVNETIAVDIEVWGFEDGSNAKMYLEVLNGSVNIVPSSYNDWTIRVSLSFANAVAFVNGKISIKDLLESKDFYAEGNIVSAIKVASVF